METDIHEEIQRLIERQDLESSEYPCTDNTMISRALRDAERWCVRLEQRKSKEADDETS